MNDGVLLVGMGREEAVRRLCWSEGGGIAARVLWPWPRRDV